MRSLKQDGPPEETTPPMDELQTIKYVVSSMNEKNRQMKTNLDNMRPIRLSRFVEEMIMGRYLDMNKVHEACADLGISLPHRYLASVCIKVTDTQGNDAPIQDVIEITSSDFCGYFSILPNSSACKGILNFSMPDKDNIRERMENFIHGLYEEKQILVTISLGSITEDFRQLGYSYIAASSALQYRFLMGDGKVLFYDEISFMEADSAPYPNREIHNLSLSISEWDAEKIAANLLSIQKYITNEKVSLRRARYICLDIIGIFINAVSVVNHTMAIDLHDNFDIFSLTEYNNMIHLCDTLELLSQKISQVHQGLCE